jgi:hypothetical protein
MNVSASASPSTVASAGQTALTAPATDSQGHGIASWSWSDGGAGGTFAPSATTQNPSYTAPENTSGANRAITLTVTAVCDGSPAETGTAQTTLTVQPAGPPPPAERADGNGGGRRGVAVGHRQCCGDGDR